jgi:hypothetical protein
VAIHWQGQRLVVVSILAQWQQPDGKFFQVCTEDEKIFELTYLEHQDVWQIQLSTNNNQPTTNHV